MSVRPAIARRDLLKGVGQVICSSRARLSSALHAADRRVRGPRPFADDRIDSWLAVKADGGVTCFTGRVDLGTGIRTALAQIVADELDVDLDRVTMVMGDTARTPDQGTTSASNTIQREAVPIRHAAADARQMPLKLASDGSASRSPICGPRADHHIRTRRQEHLLWRADRRQAVRSARIRPRAHQEALGIYRGREWFRAPILRRRPPELHLRA